MIGRAQLSEVEHDDELMSQISQQKSADESEIRRFVDEIDNLCDEKDWKTLRTYFSDEVDVDFSLLAGGEPSKISADDLIKGWKTNLFAEKVNFLPARQSSNRNRRRPRRSFFQRLRF